MLYPQENKIRGIIDLNGVWDFALGTTEEPGDAVTLPEQMEPIAVPASYNDQKDDIAYRNHYGYAYYRRNITVPSYYKGQRLVLRFDAVTHFAKIYLNGVLLTQHKGGFLPFEVDITDKLCAGESAELVVAVDNRINHSTLPVGNEEGTSFMGADNAGVPGVEAAKRWRKPQNLPNFDFFNYAGINRPVRIYTTPKAYIKDVTLVTDIRGTDGIVNYQVKTSDTDGQEVVLQILDADGNEVTQAKGASGEIVIPDAKLWEPYPGTPYLYTAAVTFGDDYYEELFGVRTVCVEGTSFLINGKPFYFKGFGKHEDSAFHGRGMDVCLDVKDVNLIHWLHANSFRTSHYPYAEEMYRLCDREGIVIIDEVPAVGIGVGAGINPYETFPIREHHEQVIKDMIARDKNHPCVVMWSLGNEPDTENFPESAYEYWHSLYELAHETDPSNRPVTLVCCQNNYEKDIVTRRMDVVCINRNYGGSLH